MFDITNYVQLNNIQKIQYNLIRSFLFCIFFIIFILFIKEIIFPTQIFNFKNSIHSLANTISTPYESNDGTSFHIFTQGDYNKAELTITLPKNSPKLPQNTTLLIKKSYLAFLSPINSKKYNRYKVKTYEFNDTQYLNKQNELYKFISKKAFESYLFKNNIILPNAPQNTLTNNSSLDITGFAPATLISSKSSIYVIDGNEKHPIQDERTFLTLGYNFDNVLKTNSEERSIHKNAKLFTVRSSHPPGTLFYTTDSNKIFIFDNNLLNKIPLTAKAKQHAIIVTETSRTTTTHCTLKKTIIPRQYKCKVSLNNISTFPGNTYQFILKDAPNTQIQNSKIKLFTTLNKKSLQSRIEAIKRKFNTNYN